MFRKTHNYIKGRIIFIDRDYRFNASIRGGVRVTVQSVVFYFELKTDMRTLLPFEHQQSNREMFVLELDLEISEVRILKRSEVYLNLVFSDDQEPKEYDDDRYYIRHVIVEDRIFPVQMLPSTRGELKIQRYDRQYLVETYATKGRKVYSLSFALFVDDFEVHRNMYRAIKAFYWILFALSYAKRRKLANCFTISLGSHDADMKDIVAAMESTFAELGAECNMSVNEENAVVCAFTMMLLGDMPQQADNAGFMRHTAIHDCRACLCFNKDYEDLDYDISINARTHWGTIQDREYAMTLTKQHQKKFLQNQGLRLNSSAIARLTSALDFMLSRTYDASHFE